MNALQNQEFDEFNQDYSAKTKRIAFDTFGDNSYRTVLDMEEENVRDINEDVILQIGQKVEHKKFGTGKITNLDGPKAEVEFDNYGTKKLISNFLKPC